MMSTASLFQVLSVAAESAVSVGVASIGGVVNVAGLAITGAISGATHLALPAPSSPRAREVRRNA